MVEEAPAKVATLAGMHVLDDAPPQEAALAGMPVLLELADDDDMDTECEVIDVLSSAPSDAR